MVIEPLPYGQAIFAGRRHIATSTQAVNPGQRPANIMSDTIYKTARILFVIGLLAVAAQAAEDYSASSEVNAAARNVD